MSDALDEFNQNYSALRRSENEINAIECDHIFLFALAFFNSDKISQIVKILLLS